MEEWDRELLVGMGNCYKVCREDFEETVRMVAGSRGLTRENVKSRLTRLKEEFGGTEEYKVLRARLPDDFPM